MLYEREGVGRCGEEGWKGKVVSGREKWDEGCVETTGGRLGPVSRLRVKAASPSDSGNYSCSAPDADTATVLIQVLDGESSAAMQHSTNSSSSTRVVHPTVSTIISLISLSLVLGIRC
ncbi:hypothetical protein Pmani_027905 [Petrolisthes manimaculis]|uniref:Ig-like domain-containing protein n=1 Tax=Petrolisthes manimaculis TaxID=1843537 RepID=A0AAE1TYL6_9EUCA|nr:hypothetical protein Pmani_027905 [Petrolisthes manimaculis]